MKIRIRIENRSYPYPSDELAIFIKDEERDLVAYDIVPPGKSVKASMEVLLKRLGVELP